MPKQQKNKSNGIELLDARLKRPQCKLGLSGICCRACLMGPCMVVDNSRSACGATQELVIAKNIVRFVAGGAAAHCGHAYHFLKFLHKQFPTNYIKKKAPAYLYKLWDKLQILPKIKFEHFKHISEALHETTMGVNADYKILLNRAVELGIVDGYYGMYLATELEDLCYGKPKIQQAKLNLGVIKPDKINIAVHGHEPMLAEALAKICMKNDINLVGVCCSGASILARHGIPMAGHVLMQEAVIATGLIDAFVVDVQCIMPSLADLAECYHTRIITTNKLCRMPNAIHLPVHNKADAIKIAKQIVEIARKNHANRILNTSVNINKSKPVNAVVGFSEYNIGVKQLTERILCKDIDGIIAVIGCVNPRIDEATRKQWINAYKTLSKRYIILTTGCMAFEFGKAGLLDGKRFFHLGSCVNNARIAEIFKRIAAKARRKITDMPFLVSAPMPITEKSIAIGHFFAALGVDVHFGFPFMFESNKHIQHYYEQLLKRAFDSKIFLMQNPKELVKRIMFEGLSATI